MFRFFAVLSVLAALRQNRMRAKWGMRPIRFGAGEFVAEDVLAFDAAIHKRINLEREFLVARADVCIRIPPILQEVRLVKVGSC